MECADTGPGRLLHLGRLPLGTGPIFLTAGPIFRLTAGGSTGTMKSMKSIGSNPSVKSKLMGTGKVCPQGWPRSYRASLTPVPTFLGS